VHEQEVEAVTTALQPESFEEFVDELRRRIGIADAVKPGELHDFPKLIGDDYIVPEQWYFDAWEELQAQGHLHQASGLAMGCPFGRLSADGRWYLRSLDEDEDEGPEPSS
jgi:hypothetical protein